MTFSGLPCLRDPKQSLKNSGSSASSSSTTSSSASPPASTTSETSNATSSNKDEINSNTKPNGLSPISPASTEVASGNGTLNLVSSSEPLSAQLIEKSFEDLVQASMNNPTETLVDMRHNNSPAVPLSQVETKQEWKQQQQQQIQTSTPRSGGATKKKSASQNINPAHSAAYRKRLNVNQVCDWCRYRKIRCDRESPCNSCQHSKRECIRTPASQLLNNIKKDTKNDETELSDPFPASEEGPKSKRSRKDDLSPRASKSYRGSSIGSHHSSSYTSYSSDQDQGDEDMGDDDESNSINNFVSPIVRSLALAKLGLNDTNFQLSGSIPSHEVNPLVGGGEAGFQDQEHLDRMKRIEVLLGNVIPGAAEFIATGRTSSQTFQPLQQPSEQRQTKPLSVVTHGLEKFPQDVVATPYEQLSKISLASPSVNTVNSWSHTSSTLQNENKAEFGQQQQQQQSRLSATDYIERMKRIELLLSTIESSSLSKSLASQPTSPKISKKEPKKKTRKSFESNSNGTPVKRPHVAAGFAGQKPPPKLPQAIAEAEQRKQKQNARKKRNGAGATRASASASTRTNADNGKGVSRTSDHESRITTPSPTASFEIPSVIKNDSVVAVSPHQSLAVPEEQQEQFYSSSHVDSDSFQRLQQCKRQLLQAYSQPPSVSGINSWAIPFSEPTGSYGSLVVPASSSTCSSATSSPRTSRAESVSFDQPASQDALSLSPDVVPSVNQMMFTESPGYLQDNFQTGNFYFRENPLAQQYQYQQPQQHVGFEGFGDLNSNESLESLMKRNMGTFEGLVGDFMNDSAGSSLQSLLQRPRSTNQLGPSLYDASSSAEQFQFLPQYQQRFHGLDINKTGQDISARSILMPNHSSSFAVPSTMQPSWSQQDRQQRQLPQQQPSNSINISASESPRSDLDLDLDFERQDSMEQGQMYQQQQQVSAHALFQQQHQQQQQRHMAQLQQQQQQQQQQIRKISFAGGPLHQHRASIQHQHQQSFYIPQMQDDEDEGEDEADGDEDDDGEF
ncbi:hypothetical protein BGX21_009695 [Mortierella sp. AD011]|nr:hypothetical protein BGX20_001631 [Mortierella sp. AD010]KAF9396009.1 hypothetical protein BGX21_009695 [Mortierella sp. AD011]